MLALSPINLIEMEDTNDILKSLKNDNLKPQLSGLITISLSLKKLSKNIFNNLIVSIISFWLLPVLRFYFYTSLFAYDIITNTELIIIVFSCLTTLNSIKLLRDFREERRKGMLIYDDITDEIEWGKRRKEFIHNRPEEARTVIRNFIKSIDLPFSDGVIGETVYLALFIIINIFTIFISYRY